MSRLRSSSLFPKSAWPRPDSVRENALGISALAKVANLTICIQDGKLIISDMTRWTPIISLCKSIVPHMVPSLDIVRAVGRWSQAGHFRARLLSQVKDDNHSGI